MDNSRGYDLLAPFYDVLVFVLFGTSLYRAQIQFLGEIPSGSKVLVLGGGTGRWLKEKSIRQANPVITFIDSSRAMIRKAEKKGKGMNITFVQGTQDVLKAGENFDVVIAYCFLDLFEDDVLPLVVDKVAGSMKPGARWFIVEFVNCKWWHAGFLSVMYLFFRATTNLRSGRLPAWQSALRAFGLRERECVEFYGGFIRSGSWQRL